MFLFHHSFEPIEFQYERVLSIFFQECLFSRICPVIGLSPSSQLWQVKNKVKKKVIVQRR